MIRLVGMILIIASTSLAGWKKAEILSETLKQMQYLYRIITMVQSEIKYARSYLGETFLTIGQQLRNPYNNWLIEIGKHLEDREGKHLEEMWDLSIKKHLTKTELPIEELHRLAELGNQLGLADMEMQMKNIDIYLKQLEESIKEHKIELQSKIKIYQSIGIMSGIFISILLL